MFTERSLSEPLSSVRDAHAPDAVVFDTERDFETLDPAVAEELGLRVDGLDPAEYPTEWLPADAPDQLVEYASGAFTVGAPGDGGVAWTRQTDPPLVFVKPRLTGSPDDFVDFLIAEALVEIGLDLPEHFLGFFGERYRDLDAIAGDSLGPAGTYQLATALFDAYVGCHSHAVFEGWADTHPDLYAAYEDAGQRLTPRLSSLSEEIATSETTFPQAAELACNAVKHDVSVPAPFDALDTAAYGDHGVDFALEWADRVL